MAHHYFIKGFQVSLECVNENKYAIFVMYIAHSNLGGQYFLYCTLGCRDGRYLEFSFDMIPSTFNQVWILYRYNSEYFLI